MPPPPLAAAACPSTLRFSSAALFCAQSVHEDLMLRGCNCNIASFSSTPAAHGAGSRFCPCSGDEAEEEQPVKLLSVAVSAAPEVDTAGLQLMAGQAVPAQQAQFLQRECACCGVGGSPPNTYFWLHGDR